MTKQDSNHNCVIKLHVRYYKKTTDVQKNGIVDK